MHKLKDQSFGFVNVYFRLTQILMFFAYAFAYAYAYAFAYIVV